MSPMWATRDLAMKFSLAIVALSVLSFAAGCSAESETAAAASPSELTEKEGAAPSNDLLEQTIVKGTITVGAKSKVAYEPELYKQTTIQGVPYLAWELVDAPAYGGIKTKANGNRGQLAIDVEGNFPGSPDVLVVDESFNLLGQARGTATDLGDKASLTIDVSEGKKFVLVRDMDWVRPMDFEISVAQ